MSTKITIDLRVEQLARDLAAMGRVTPAALAKRLNAIAYESRTEIVGGLDETFTIRRRAFLVRSIRYGRATPKDLVATVGTIQPGLAMHDTEGGTPRKFARKGLLGIPIAARPKPTDITPRSKWPGTLARRSGYFFGETRSGGLALWRRTTKNRLPIQLVYRLEESVKIPQEWPMVATVRGVADKQLLPGLMRDLDRALDRAKGKK